MQTRQRRNNGRRIAAILIIICISIAFGFIFDMVMSGIERGLHPKNYTSYIEKYAAEFGVPVNTVYAVIKVESDFRSNAVSSAGAVGLMQITPDTFEWIGFLLSESPDSRLLYDPETNIRYGTYLLSYLYSRFGNWDTVFAAYNRGMSKIYEWLDNPDYSDGNGNLTYIPVKETREYVIKVNAAIENYNKLYG